MKSILVVVAFLVVAAQAIPVKDEPKKNETLSVKPPTHNATHDATGELITSRNKRDCGAADLDKIQTKIIHALEEQLEKLLGGKLPEHGNNRTRRATSEAAASSRVNPDGTIKTSAAAKGSNDPPALAPPPPADGIMEPILTNGHQLPQLDGRIRTEEPAVGAPAEGSHGIAPHLTGEPAQPLPPSTPLPAPGQGADPVAHPIAGTGNTVQKVASKANKDTGTAVASAIAKRSAVLQTVDTTGGKAVANAESHKGAEQNIQSVTANGTHVGIANAVVDNKNASGNTVRTGSEVVLQNVAAAGVKAVATATNNKGTGSSVQETNAEGDEIAIASASSARAKREVFLISKGDFDFSAPEGEDDVGLGFPDRSAEKLIVLDRHRQTRSPCISTKFDDNLRHLIEDTVANAFADIKKELKL